MSTVRDDEKTATSPADFVVVRSVLVSSRYQKQDEVTLMVRAVDAMPSMMCAAIQELWCDSKATNTYHANLHSDFDCPGVSKWIAKWLHAFMLFERRGHNGIYVGDAVIDATWPDDINEAVP